MLEFEEQHERLPQLSELTSHARLRLTDPLSGEEAFGVTTNRHLAGALEQAIPLVWQPRSCRTAPWPFGEKRRYAFFSDQSCRANYELSAEQE